MIQRRGNGLALSYCFQVDMDHDAQLFKASDSSDLQNWGMGKTVQEAITDYMTRYWPQWKEGNDE